MKKINIGMIVTIMFFALTSGHHEKMPAGQHIMPNGQIMSGSNIATSSAQLNNNGPFYFVGGVVLLLLMFIIYVYMKNRSENGAK